MSVTNPKGALNVARRTWDKEEFARRADEREAAEEAGGAVVDEVKADDDLEKRLYRKAESAAAGPMNSQRAFLKARDFDLRMESRLHRTKVVNPNNKQDTSSFYCKLCDCSLKDNVAWADHINGKKHNRKLGYSMRVERSTAEQVKARLALMKAKGKNNKPKVSRKLSEYKQRLAERTKAFEEEEAEARRRARRKKRRKNAPDEEPSGAASDQAAPGDSGAGNGGEGAAEQAPEVGGMDPEMAAMMGFGGFGGSKKS